MRHADLVQNVIDTCEVRIEISDWFIIPTYELIAKALIWGNDKTEEQIRQRIKICEGKRDRMPKLNRQWQVMIETLRWLIEETDTDPLQSRFEILGLP